jgi:hypothetical protein
MKKFGFFVIISFLLFWPSVCDGAGDLIFMFAIGAGSINCSVNMSYHTH